MTFLPLPSKWFCLHVCMCMTRKRIRSHGAGVGDLLGVGGVGNPAGDLLEQYVTLTTVPSPASLSFPSAPFLFLVWVVLWFFFSSPGLGLENWNLTALGCLGIWVQVCTTMSHHTPIWGWGVFRYSSYISAWLETYVDQVDIHIHVPLPFECCD